MQWKTIRDMPEVHTIILCIIRRRNTINQRLETSCIKVAHVTLSLNILLSQWNELLNSKVTSFEKIGCHGVFLRYFRLLKPCDVIYSFAYIIHI